jgi:hypothetical protein
MSDLDKIDEIEELDEIEVEEFGQEADSLTEAVEKANALAKEFKRSFAILEDYTVVPSDSARRNILLVVEYS